MVASTAVAVVRRHVARSELASVVPACCGTVWNVLRAQGIQGGRNVAIYWDGGVRLEAGVEMAGAFQETADVVRSATPSGAVASVVHRGPYGQLGAAHEAIRRWCAAHSYAFSGPNWEVYGHWQEAWNADPSQIQTEVFYQVVAETPAVG
jgi:effector-binding domain-containing protein